MIQITVGGSRGWPVMSFRGWLAIVFVVLFAVSAIRPWHPQDFAIEHILTAVAVAGLMWADHRRSLSNLSAVLIFCFLSLHLLGAHYTYSEVPYDAWSEAVTGTPISEWFGWTRNHYDRLVHAAFGLLLVYPARELLARLFPELPLRDVRLLAVTVLVLAVLSKVYELLEWAITLVMTQDAAAMYNGEQGDVRDAHKDMALALAGTIISAVLIFLYERPAQRALNYKPKG
jgi:putative membrane protein